MLSRLFFTLTAVLAALFVCGQNFPAYIKANAVQLIKQDSLGDSVYKLLDSFPLIMAGEMHGTNEPAKLVIGLAKLFSDKGDSVQVGFEIPSRQMTKFLAEHSDSSVYSSEFFADGTADGRGSMAWAEAIITLSKIKNVKLPLGQLL